MNPEQSSFDVGFRHAACHVPGQLSTEGTSYRLLVGSSGPVIAHHLRDAVTLFHVCRMPYTQSKPSQQSSAISHVSPVTVQPQSLGPQCRLALMSLRR